MCGWPVSIGCPGPKSIWSLVVLIEVEDLFDVIA
jgi:hypothetical protein